MTDSTWTIWTTRTKSTRTSPKSSPPDSAGPARAQGAPKSKRRAPSPQGQRRSSPDRGGPSGAGERETGVCVHCGGPWPLEAMAESAAARLARHYRREVTAHADRVTAALVQASLEHHQLTRALGRLFPRLLDATRVPAKRPALERALLEFQRKFLDEEGDL
jgi:hypothetical protein